MDSDQDIQNLVDKVVLELQGIQSVYFDEEITQADAEIVTVPAHTLQSLTVPNDPQVNNKKKKKTDSTTV